MRVSRLSFFACALALAMAALASLPMVGDTPAAEPIAPTLHLHTGDIRPALGLDRAQALAAAERQAALQADAVTYVVQFAGPVQPDWHDALAQHAEILAYLPDFAYKVKVERSVIPALWNLPGMVWAGPWENQNKLSPELAFVADQPVIVWSETHSEIGSKMTAQGLKVLSLGTGYIVTRGTRAELLALASDPAVDWIQPLRRPRLTNDVATGLIGAQTAWTSGWDGSGQLITVADTGIDTGVDYPQVVGDMHPDLDNRVAHIHSWDISPAWYAALYNPTDNDGAADVDFGHGTHVAGSVAGNGTRSGGLYMGVAPKAQLAFQALEQYCEWTPAYVAAGYEDYMLVGIPQDVSELYDEAYDWGSRIHTNSWNLGETSLYTQEAAHTDAFIWEHPDMCVLFSVGNEGRDGNSDGLVDLGSIATPATAKNIIAVGGTETLRMDHYSTYGVWLGDWFPVNPIRDDTMANAGIDGMLAMSGRGPTSDGRIAPHILAPGSWIVSILSSRATTNYGSWGPVFPYGDDYHYLGGTSMSAPLAAGAVALVRQAYMAQGHTPSAALLKATMIQSAKDIPGQYASPYNQAGPVPNMSEGWGAIDLASATNMSRHWRDDTTTVSTGQTIAHTFDAGASSRSVKITLVWSDAPADPQASVSLVNDLDLRVTAPDGSSYKGNVFHSGWSVTGGSSDRTNNVECVYLPTAQEGQYTATVTGYNVPIVGQRFALLLDAPAPQSPRAHLPLALRAVSPTPSPTLDVTTTPSLTPTPTLPPTATPTPSPSATPSSTATPTMAPDEWRDDFSDASGDPWYVVSDDTFRMGYAGETYRIEVSPSRGQVGSLPARVHAGDYRLSVTTWMEGEGSQAQGIILSCQEDAGGNVTAYLGFVVTDDGRYGIVRRDGTYLVGLTPSGVIATDGAPNRLVAQRIGNEIACEVNGTRLITMENVEVGLGERFGLMSKAMGGNWTDSRFDDFWFQPLGAAPSADGRRTAPTARVD